MNVDGRYTMQKVVGREEMKVTRENKRMIVQMWCMHHFYLPMSAKYKNEH